MEDYKNILIIKMSSLGDIIHALPSLYVLRKRFSNARITWAVHEGFSGILPGKPWIDEIYVVKREKIKQLRYLSKVRKDLHRHHFDLVIDLQMIAKSGLISALSGCSNRIGYNDAREGSGIFSRPISGMHKNGHIIEQLLDVTRYLGCEVKSIEFPLHEYRSELLSVRDKLTECGVGEKYVLLVPGTRGENKKWPNRFWGELASLLAENNIYTVISGTSSEKHMAEEILKVSKSPYVVDFTGETNLLELLALEKMAELHISGDTGPLHIANAVHTPIIALFGPTLPDRSGPYGNNESQVLLAKNPGHRETDMATIQVETVFNLCMQKLKT